MIVPFPQTAYVIMSRQLQFVLLVIFVATVSSATTKKPVPICGKCMPKKVTLIPASGAGTVKPTVKMLTNTAAGCRRMHVICTAPAGGTTASMEFNKQFGGGFEAKTVTALVKCNAKQNWIYTKDKVA
ncbi:hypothetical protein TELCIR_12819, partial [Teladorsagia circumcincta]